jgi:hypothetical protein
MKPFLPAIALVSLFASQAVMAQSMPADGAKPGPGGMPAPGMKQPMRPMPPRPGLPPLPTAEQLQRMLPPEPPTEEAIKQRFSQQRARLEETLERDRKAAEQYAKDFARMQKFQAGRLAQLMAQAEKRREAVIQRLNEHEQSMLERFRKMRSAQQPGAETKPSAEQAPASE